MWYVPRRSVQGVGSAFSTTHGPALSIHWRHFTILLVHFLLYLTCVGLLVSRSCPILIQIGDYEFHVPSADQGFAGRAAILIEMHDC